MIHKGNRRLASAQDGENLAPRSPRLEPPSTDGARGNGELLANYCETSLFMASYCDVFVKAQLTS